MAEIAWDIVTVIAAVLFLITGWAVITGRYHRFYNDPNKRPDWVPSELHPFRGKRKKKSK